MNEKLILIYAAEIGNIEVVRILLAAGVDVNHKDRINSTAFHWALMNRKIDILWFLIKISDYINIKNYIGDDLPASDISNIKSYIDEIEKMFYQKN